MTIKTTNPIKAAVLFFAAALLLSCNQDILDQIPKDSLTEETVWSDPQGAIQFVNGIYGDMPSGFDRNYDNWAKGLYLLDGASDDADVSMGWTHSTQLQTGNFLPSYVPWGNTMWPTYYRLIRKANVALENLDRLDDEELSTRLKGEVYFLRGFMYHELLRLFGLRSAGGEPTGVPLISESLTLDDNLQIPRATYADVVSFIISDLDKAASILPEKGGIEEGRATSGAAKALKSRVLLYDEQWEAAANAAQEVMNMPYTLFPDYRTLFLTKNNDEIIFAKKFRFPDKHHQTNAGGTAGAGWDVYNTPPSFKGPTDAGWGGNLPTQNFVDSYEMTDGLPQTASPLYDPEKPYENLDPRFEATVVHNGATFRGREVELFEGGRDADFMVTGYFTRKFHNEDLVIYSQSSDQDWIFVRYAEVLLNYAEAKNEASGPDGTVYEAINAIRARPGVDMPPLPQGLSQDQMRERIRHERRVELAFEEHRFFDIRRWRIAESLLNGPLQGMKIEKNADGSVTYNRYDFETRAFPSKLYVLPIPQEEIDKNPAAEQINGW
ncbi:Starch-binding associating with outer membrane [Catalinimonas alkaloidigena]|uniref:Starch-binding associating with outer membrane n=1 Tax=Catalinimonas alkaloidigena TaxID=1075417 RepID=A0A1G9HMR1_9BACT|nr:RagB/SusD family nutrient uptake outer membrane protein [Catalinimonas alkaloidigena]SDL14229.1 Starch-binding associating with outer membrane [Catalinimonas alkaloidigena]